MFVVLLTANFLVILLPTLQQEQGLHCVERVQIRSDFWSVFSLIQTEYGPEIPPYLDSFHAVLVTLMEHPIQNYPKTYLERSHTSKMELFAKIVNGFKYFSKKSLISDVTGAKVLSIRSLSGKVCEYPTLHKL